MIWAACSWIACGLLVICAWSPAQDTKPENKPLIGSIQGAALYAEYCAVCHGKDGKGNGIVAHALKTAPPDLTRLAARNNGKFPSERVQQTIASNEPVAAAHGSREMPIWGPVFSQITWDQDLGRLRIYNLAKYLESMQGK